METILRACARSFKSALITIVFVFSTAYVSANTTNWTGTTNNDWFTSTNWDNGVPGAVDDAVIGINVAYANQPMLNSLSAAVTTINSITFGPYLANVSGVFTFNGVNAILTVSANDALVVNTGIILSPNANLYGTYSAMLAGSGSITCASVQVGDLATFPSGAASFSNSLQLQSTLAVFHIAGGVTINAASFGNAPVLLSNNSTVSLQGGTTIIDGKILTTYASSGTAGAGDASAIFSVDMPTGSALSPVLKLTNATPVDASCIMGSIDFYNNTGGTGTSTIGYSGTNQTVYTTTTTALDNSPQTYQNLALSGVGTKTIGESNGGTLNIGKGFSTTATAILLDTYNPDVAIGGNWFNGSSVTQGSGNIVVTGSFTNITGGTLNLGAGNFSIAANYTNQAGGVYSQGTGTTIFNGAGSQSLVDNSTTGTTFNAVAFNGGGTATMNAGASNANFAVASTGVLTMSNGSTLIAGSSSDPYLTLKSDTDGAATVAAIPAGCSITGFVTVQRFVQGNPAYNAVRQRWVARNYRLMSSQVNEGPDNNGYTPCSLNYLGASTIITDCTSTYGTTPGNPSLYIYNEWYTPSNSSFTSGNFIGITDISSTTASGNISTTDAVNPLGKIYAGEGFMMYFRGDKITHITGSPNKTTFPYVAPESVIFSATGNLNQGSTAVRSWTNQDGLLYTTSNYPNNAAVQGFNLVGNPYPSSIDWGTFSNSDPSAPIYGENITPSIYILNPITSNYDSYNVATGIANGSASNIIPSGQGFFVQANAASPKLTFNESAKVTAQITGSNLLLGTPASQSAYNSYLRLKLVVDSVSNDDIVIGFNSKATTKYDHIGDSGFLPGIGTLGSLAGISSDNIKTSVKWLPYPKANPDRVIKLYVMVAASGTYTLQRTDFKAIPQIYQVWLMDNYKKDSLDIRNNTTYAFNVNLNDTASYGSSRFKVIIRQDPALGVHLLNFTATKSTGGAQVVWVTENEQNYTNFIVERSNNNGGAFNAIGGEGSNALGTYSLLDKKPASGANQYRLKIEDLNGAITYSRVITLMYGNGSNSLAVSNVSVFPNPAQNVLNLSINPTTATGLVLNQSVIPAYGATAGAALYSIEIVSNNGSVIKTATTNQANWQTDVSGLMPGSYVIRVINSGNKSIVGNGAFVKL